MVFLLASDHKRFFAPALLGLGLCALFAWMCSQFYVPGKGFTFLIEFGGAQHERFLPALKAVNHFELKDSIGYDGQYYAQIAMEPDLGNADLHRAVDNLPYRARRILLSWIAYALARGDAVRALHLFAAENLFCWFALGLLFCRWMPPWRWTGLVRWFGLMFSFGLCCSVRGSLVDGPSLLLIALAVAFAEESWFWCAALVLGLAGLARETNLLALPILLTVDHRKSARSAGAIGAQFLLAVAPLAAWLVILKHWIGGSNNLGGRNFAIPIAGYFGKWQEVIGHLSAGGFDRVAWGSLFGLIALTAQWLGVFFGSRRRLQWSWVGIIYALFGLCLGPAVWEGFPGAACRVLLPVTAAFFVNLPLGQEEEAASQPAQSPTKRRGRRSHLRTAAVWIAWALGTAGVLVAPDILHPPGRESAEVHGPRDLRMVERTGQTVEVIFDGSWYDPERSWLEYWRWSNASGEIRLVNPHPFPVKADISFGLRANDARTVAVRTADRTLWLGRLAPATLRPVVLPDVTLAPGATTWRFESLELPFHTRGPDGRNVTISLRDLRVDLH